MSCRVVVLHGVDDVEVTKRCCQTLEEAGISCWSPYIDLTWSRDPHADTREAIDAGHGVVLIVGGTGDASEDVLQLLSYSLLKEKFSFLGTPNGVPSGELAKVLWDGVCNLEAGEVAPIVNSISDQPAPITFKPSVITHVPESYAAYPRGGVKLKGDLRNYENLKSHSSWAIAFVGLATLIFFIATLAQFRTFSSVLGLSSMSPDETSKYLEQVGGAFLWKILAFAIMLLSLIPFLIWVVRAVKNLQNFGVEGLGFSSGFAALGFFVPVVNLVFPVMVMSNLSRASKPWSRPNAPSTWKENKTPDFVVLWIVAWYAGAYVLPGVVGRMGSEKITPIHRVVYLAGIETLSGLVLMLAGGALCYSIAKISQWQEERFLEIAADLNPMPQSATGFVPQAAYVR